MRCRDCGVEFTEVRLLEQWASDHDALSGGPGRNQRAIRCVTCAQAHGRRPGMDGADVIVVRRRDHGALRCGRCGQPFRGVWFRERRGDTDFCEACVQVYTRGLRVDWEDATAIGRPYRRDRPVTPMEHLLACRAAEGECPRCTGILDWTDG